MEITATTTIRIGDGMGGVDLDMSTTVQRHAGGNPLFVESECANALKESIDRLLAAVVAATPGAKQSA